MEIINLSLFVYHLDFKINKIKSANNDKHGVKNNIIEYFNFQINDFIFIHFINQ